VVWRQALRLAYVRHGTFHNEQPSTVNFSPVTLNLFTLLAAIPVVALGGTLFLKGVLALAAWLRLPKLLVATTLAAFATSSPEMAVSSLAAIAGKPEIGLGNALGANVVNVGMILGIALLFGALAARSDELRRDLVLALSAPTVTVMLALDGMLSRADGALLLLLFAVWFSLVVRQAITHRREMMTDTGQPVGVLRAWLFLLGGLAALILAGRLFVTGASSIAVALGLQPYLIGATIVAVGTTLPELVTVLLSRLRDHDDVGLGTLLGSNLFNGLAIVGVAASIHPIRAPVFEVAIALVFGVLTVLLMLPRAGTISRRRGLALLAAYATFVFFTFGAPL
jgi:cation:H+ antiporter